MQAPRRPWVSAPYLAGYSRRCAQLAVEAARLLGFGDDATSLLRRAALVHDFGMTAVPNSIMDKTGPLTRSEMDRVELHLMLTEQMLGRSPALAVLASQLRRLSISPKSRPRVLGLSRRTTAAMSNDLFAHRGRHFFREALHLWHGIRGRTKDECVHSMFDRQFGELVHPLWDPALQETTRSTDLAPHVVDPRDLGGVAAGSDRSVVDPRLHVGKLVRRGPSARGHPAIGGSADKCERPAAPDAEPDANRVDRCRPRLHSGEPVVTAVEADRALVRPHQPDDVDGLDESVDRLARRPPRTTHGLDRLPERSRSESELESPARQNVQARGRLGQHRGRSQRQVRHIWEHADTLRLREHGRHQHPSVEEAPLIWVVLDTDVLEALLVRDSSQREDLVQ